MKKRLLFASILILGQWIIALASHAQGWNVSQIGYIPFWGGTSRAAYENGLVYVATGLTGLRIVDVSNPTNPVEIGYLSDDSSYASDLVLDSNLIFLSSTLDPGSELAVIDVSNPFNPYILSSYLFTENYSSSRIYKQTNTLYLSHDDSLFIFDATVPSQPFPIGAYHAPHAIGAQAYMDTVGYLLEGYGLSSSILEILDLSSPDHPRPVGSIYIPDCGSDLRIWNGYLLVLNGHALHIFNIDQPANPVVVGTAWLNSLAFCLAVDGNTGYIAEGYIGENGVQIVDLSNPAQPELQGFAQTATGTGIDAENGWVYVAGVALTILQVTNPYDPTVICSYGGGYGQTNQVVVKDNYVITATDYFLIPIFLDHPDSIACIFRMTQLTHEIALWGDYLYASTQDSFLILDTSNPLAMNRLGGLFISSSSDICPIGSYVYLEHLGGITILNVLNPAQPTILADFSWLNLLTFRLDFSENYVYICGGTVQPEEGGYLQILDVSHPTSPQQIGLLLLPEFINDVKIIGEYAIVAAYDHGLYIINISNPNAPTLAGTFSTLHPAYSLTLCGNNLFVAEFEGGFEILNLINPLNPSLTGYYNTPGSTCNLAVSGDTAFVADYYYFGTYDCSQALSTAPHKPSFTPASFALSPANPNPFNSTTNLRYNLPASQHVTLKVFDIQGREIITLVNSRQEAGEHQVIFEGSGLASGVYLVKMQAGSFSATEKIVLLK